MAKQANITDMHHDYAARYAQLAGMSVKAAIEYAIERTLVTELIAFSPDEEVPQRESDRLLEEACRLLPADWSVFIQDAMSYPPTVVLHFGIGAIHDVTEIRQATLLEFSRSLELLAEFGGVAILKGENVTPDIVVRRRGQGLIFAHEGQSTKLAKAKTSIPTKMVESVTQGFRKAVQAAESAGKE